MGYPASVGVLWHVTERIAVRPELAFARTWNDRDGSTSVESSSWTLGVGVSALFYLTRADNLRTYVSPRYAYSRSSSTASSDIFVPLESRLRSASSSIFGSFGAQYALGRRFGVFGEVGLGYSRQSLRSFFSESRSTAHAVTVRSGAGVILYF